MRKSIYIAAALATVALVGCQKELAPVVGAEQAGNAGLDQRPVLVSSALTFGGPETRAFAGGTGGYNWKYEAGDQVGAMIVDEVSFTKQLPGYATKSATAKQVGIWGYEAYAKNTSFQLDNVKYYFKDTYKTRAANAVLNDAEEFYTITPKQIWTNYPYTTEDAKVFNTPATLVEGHYMFYAPYNAGNGTRGPLVATLPVKQEVGANGNEAVDAFFKGENPAVLTVNYLSAAETSTVEINPGHIFAYPEFTISNKFNGYLFDGGESGTSLISTAEKDAYTMVLKSVEFYTGNGSLDLLAYKRTIDPEKVYENGVKADKWLLNVAKKGSYEGLLSTADFTTPDEKEKNAFTSTEVLAMNNGPKVSTAQVWGQQQRIIVDLGGYELPYGETYSFNVVMPAVDYTTAGLYARLVVEIDGQDYYIVSNDVSATGTLNSSSSVYDIISNPLTSGDEKGHVTFKQGNGTDYRFVDRHNRGFKKLEMARGNRYTKVEINESNTVKDHAGELLTIELVGGKRQVAVAVSDDPVMPTGIENNEQFIDFLNGVDNTADVKEITLDELGKKEDEEDYTVFALAEDNEVVIDDALIEALADKVKQGKLILLTNLPIDEGVTVTKSTKVGAPANTYTFTASDGKTKFDITYKTDLTVKADGKLHDGINVVSSSATISATEDMNAMVFVQDDAVVTLKDATGIAGIVIEAGRLKVDSKEDVEALVTVTGTRNGSKVDTNENAFVELISGGLVNEKNDLTYAKEVKNQALATIGGKVGTDNVTYTRNGFGNKEIPAETRINSVTIDAAQPMATALDVTQADFNRYSKLDHVTFTFTEKFATKGLKSDATITLTNVVKLVYKDINTPLSWSAEEAPVEGVYVKATGKAEQDFFVRIIPAGAMVFQLKDGLQYNEDETPIHDIEDAANVNSDIFFGDDLTGTKEKTDDSAVINMSSGTIEGNEYALDATAKFAVKASTGTIQNLTIDAKSNNDWSATNSDGWASRAIYAHMSDDVTIDNCVLKGGYSLNADGFGTLTVKNTYLYGWCSWSNTTTEFEGCHFLKGAYFTEANTDVEHLKKGEIQGTLDAIEAVGAVNYSNAVCRPYKSTTFRNCDFPADWVFDFSHMASNTKVIFENCTIGGKKLTSPAQFNGYDDAEMLVKKAEQFVKPTWSTTIGGCVTIR